MALSVVDLYVKILPRTNCKDCGFPTCIAFSARKQDLEIVCKKAGGTNVKDRYESPDLAFQFRVFPKIFITLLFWDESEGFEADVKLLFDETILDHLDIEATLFLSEHLCRMLTDSFT